MLVPRELISPSGCFSGCICTSSRNSEAADSDVFMSDIYKHQKLVNGGRRDRSCFVVCLGCFDEEGVM